MEPEITVVIPVFNGQEFLDEAIESVLGQTFARWKLVVSDNCSTDSTRDLVRRHADPRIRLLENPVNIGMTANFNKCLDAVDTKYYLVLCHDDFLYAPHALEAAHEALEINPLVPAVYCDLVFVEHDRKPIMVRSYHRNGLVDASRLATQSVHGTRNLFGIPLLVRTAALNGHRYDSSLAFALDLDLSIAVAKGKSIFHIPEPLIGNRYHGSNQTGVLLRTLLSEMLVIGRKQGIPLDAFDVARMRVSSFYTTLGRWAFLTYARSKRKFGRT